MNDIPAELSNRTIIMNGFTDEEIARIMRVVKPLFEHPRDLIFAITTPTSLKMRLGELIVDMSKDHEYLKQHPPTVERSKGT